MRLECGKWMWEIRGGGVDVPGTRVAWMPAFLKDSNRHELVCRTSHTHTHTHTHTLGLPKHAASHTWEAVTVSIFKVRKLRHEQVE